MKRVFLFSGGILAIVMGVFALAYLTSAATTKFAFTGRGVVQEHDFSGKNMRVNFTQLSERAKAIGLGTSQDMSVGNTKFYKKDGKGTLRRIKQGNIAIGEEISLRGTVRSDDRFVASHITVIDTSFVMKGKLRTYSTSQNSMTVDIDTSNFRSSQYIGKVVTFSFPNTMKVFSRGQARALDEVIANDQKIQIEGKLIGNAFLEVTKLLDNIP